MEYLRAQAGVRSTSPLVTASNVDGSSTDCNIAASLGLFNRKRNNDRLENSVELSSVHMRTSSVCEQSYLEPIVS
jgi:hypothetical protein